MSRIPLFAVAVKFPRYSRWLVAAVALLAAVGLNASPDHWKAEIDKLTAADATTPPPKHGVVFVGSSSIRLWSTLATDFPGVATINRGFGGSELADSVFYFDRIVLPYEPRLVVLFAGTNDIWSGKSPEAVFADFEAFRKKLHAGLPHARLIYLALTLSPSRARVHEAMRATNRLIAAACAADSSCTFLDFNPALAGADGLPRTDLFRADQLHLNPDGYAIWARELKPHLHP